MNAATQAALDQQRARVREHLDTNYSTLTEILHAEGQLAEVVRLAIGAVVLDLQVMLRVAPPDTILAALCAWAAIAEPELSW